MKVIDGVKSGKGGGLVTRKCSFSSFSFKVFGFSGFQKLWLTAKQSPQDVTV